MEYRLKPSNKHYSFSYRKLKELYQQYVEFTDEEFMEHLVDILHFATFVAWIKELPNETTLSDEGIVHQLVHLLSSTVPITDLKEIRTDFEVILKLS